MSQPMLLEAKQLTRLGKANFALLSLGILSNGTTIVKYTSCSPGPGRERRAVCPGMPAERFDDKIPPTTGLQTPGL